MAILFVLPYLSALIFAVAVGLRWVKFARMPLNLRWELHPLAHERGAPRGGFVVKHAGQSQTRLRRLGKLTVMMPEIFLLEGVRDHNRSLWLRSYPFHLGLYLSGGFAGLLITGALAEAGGVRVAPGAAGLAGALATATAMVGATGFVLLGAGSLGLLARRLRDPVLRESSAWGDFINLGLFLAQATLGLLAFARVDGNCGFLRGFLCAVVSFQRPPGVPWPVAAEIVMGCALVAYVPLTHMSHFFTKWFLYHHVRWDDRPNRAGSTIEATLRRQLGYKVDWNGPHIRGGGQKTWVDVATDEGPGK